MKITKHDLNRLLCLLFWALCLPVAYAELTATVYPGYTLSANERPTTAILNLLARPTVSVSGTLGGTNVGLAANSVSGAMLQTSVVDDNTIEFFNNGGSTAIRLKAYNTGTNAISSNLAGLGLGGGDGYALSNKTDNATITITNDVLTLKSNLSPVYLQWVTNTLLGAATYGTNANLTVGSGIHIQNNAVALRQLETAEVTLSPSGILLSTNHGLGLTPSWVKAVFVCKTNDLSWNAGDEVGMDSVYNSAGATTLTVSANATSITVYGAVNTSSFAMIQSNGLGANVTTARWRLKIYARP
jgi:hypothetical protein